MKLDPSRFSFIIAAHVIVLTEENDVALTFSVALGIVIDVKLVKENAC